MTKFIDMARAAIGNDHVLQGNDVERWSKDWSGKYSAAPATVLRPGSTAEVSELMKAASATGTAIVPVSGHTGLAGGAFAPGGILLSLDRMNKIRELRPEGRMIVAEAGVILSSLHDAAGEHDLIFPLTFGARGSCMVGGFLSTNAGGSNVLRYGNTRDLCLGIEVVLADGRIMNLMSALHKDNSGLNLRHLMIGAEGTLGIITAAVLKLQPKPKAYATAMLAVPSLQVALTLLHKMQAITGGAVEAFEYMPRSYIEGHLQMIEGARAPFEEMYDVNIMIEIGATAPRDATPLPDGSIPVVNTLEDALGEMLEAGDLLDAVLAKNEAQRAEMWARREAAAEIIFIDRMRVDNDVAVPVDKVAEFLDITLNRVREYDPGAEEFVVAHLGDGNIHYMIYPAGNHPSLVDRVMETVEDVVAELGGSFSAEHGIGLGKLPSMRRRKDPVALDVMRSIKSVLDPQNIMNPGKVIPAKED